MTALGVHDAVSRTVVLLTRPDHPPVTATLIHWPVPKGQRRRKEHGKPLPARGGGTKAKVKLPSGKVISVEPAHLERVF